MINESIRIRWLGQEQNYLDCWQAMRDFTDQRNSETMDEIWLLEHAPVFTQGQNGKPEHILNPGTIPIVQTDRGGQVTYHGPGQLMVYTLIDLKRKHINIRDFVSRLENSVIEFLAEYNLTAVAKREAPGVYVEGKKICSIGLRVRRGCTYHGIAFNLAMDLTPFKRINPCGFTALEMTQLYPSETAGKLENTLTTSRKLINYLIKNLVYTHANIEF